MKKALIILMTLVLMIGAVIFAVPNYYEYGTDYKKYGFDKEVMKSQFQYLKESIMVGDLSRRDDHPSKWYGKADCGGVIVSVNQDADKHIDLVIENKTDVDMCFNRQDKNSLRVIFDDGTGVSKGQTNQEGVFGANATTTIRIRDKRFTGKECKRFYIVLNDINLPDFEGNLSKVDGIVFPVVAFENPDDYESVLKCEDIGDKWYGKEWKEYRSCEISQNSSNFITAHYVNYVNELLKSFNHILDSDLLTTITDQNGEKRNTTPLQFLKRYDDIYVGSYYEDIQGPAVYKDNYFTLKITEQGTDSESEEKTFYKALARYNVRKEPTQESESIYKFENEEFCVGTGEISEDASWIQICLNNGSIGWTYYEGLQKADSSQTDFSQADLAQADFSQADNTWTGVGMADQELLQNTETILNAVIQKDFNVLHEKTNMDVSVSNNLLGLIGWDIDKVKCEKIEYAPENREQQQGTESYVIYKVAFSGAVDDDGLCWSERKTIPVIYKDGIFISPFDDPGIINVQNRNYDEADEELYYTTLDYLNMAGRESEYLELADYMNDYMYFLSNKAYKQKVDEYNRKVQEYNQKVEEYNELVAERRRQIEEYNQAVDEFVENVRENVYQAVDEYMDGNASQPNITICPICGGTGQQYIPNMFYDTVVGWQGGNVSCGGCGGMGYY